MKNVQIFENMPNKEYHANPALSSSGLLHLDQSPAHYQEYRANPPEQTKEKLIGSAVHAAFLENGFGSEVLLAPGSTRNTNLYKDFVSANPGKIHLLADEYEDVQTIVDKLRGTSAVNNLFQGGKAESSIFWTDPETGINCRCRPDYLLPDGTIIDLKTTADASDEGVLRSVKDWKYHWQTAFYLDGVSALMGKKITKFVHVFVEKKSPYGIAIRMLSDDCIERSRYEVRHLLKRFAESEKSKSWTNYPTSIKDLVLPDYFFKQELSA